METREIKIKQSDWDKNVAFKKVEKVIKSCKTAAQLDCANKMIDNFVDLYWDDLMLFTLWKYAEEVRIKIRDGQYESKI